MKKQIENKNDEKVLDIIRKKTKKFNKNSFSSIEVIFLIIVAALVGIGVGFFLNKNNYKNYSDEENEIIKNYNYILNNYYKKIDKSKLVSGAVDGMLNTLDDDYAELLSQEDDSSIYMSLQGSYDGIGIEIYNDENNDIVVLGVLEDSPALKAGIQKGDIIKKVDEILFQNRNIKELTSYIKNNDNKEYNVVVLRNGEEINLVVEKKTVTIKSVLSKVIEKEDKKIGYIYISIFSNTTFFQFKNALNELEKNDIDSLIIDVRENSGGHLSTAVSILSNFLDNKKVIYQIEKNNKKTKYYSEGVETKTYPIVVIQNGNSASASELLASALKESYGATIVGETSYGKGTVQELNSLTNGDSYKFTTKKWLTPKGNWINEKGIKPDIEVKISEDYINNPSDETDNQLNAAIDFLMKESN